MNQDQIKALLLQLADPPEDFSVVFTGKKSRKVDGLYRPETRELIIHNRNHLADHDLIHTAIHEYAHHLQFCEASTPISGRVHTKRFWAILHSLLEKAEARGLYRSPFDTVEEFRSLTARLRRLIAEGGAAMKQLGALLAEARDLCAEHHADFGDYLDRALGLPRSAATAAERAARFDLDPRVGFEGMKVLARIPEPEARASAERSLLGGRSLYLVQESLAAGRSERREPDPLRALESEKRRIQRTIERLRQRLEEIERRIEGIRHSSTLGGSG